MAIHEEAGSTRQAQLLRLFQVFLYRRSFSAVVQALVEAVAIQLEHARVVFKFCDLELLAIKKHVVILPELSLLAGASGGLSRFLRSVMHGEREVFVHHCQPVSVFLLQLSQLRHDLLAIRTLIVGELNQRYWRILGATYVGIFQIHIGEWRRQQNLNTGTAS